MRLAASSGEAMTPVTGGCSAADSFLQWQGEAARRAVLLNLNKSPAAWPAQMRRMQTGCERQEAGFACLRSWDEAMTKQATRADSLAIET